MAKENLYEKRRHGDLLFPFQHYAMVTDTCNIFVPYHWHEEVEIILVMEGAVELLLDGQKQVLSAGDIIFINSGQLHQFTSLTRHLIYYAYVFPLNSLCFQEKDITQTSILEPLANHALCFPTLLPKEEVCYPKIHSLIKAIILTNEKKEECFQLLTKAYLCEIIGLLSQNGLLKRQLTPSKELDTYRQILLYIQEHYQEKITVADIASHLCMSANYFSAYFTHHFGKSFIEFLNHYRIEKACVLLTAEGLCVTQTALQTGFENISYFIKRFKSITGLTPAAYQRQHKK